MPRSERPARYQSIVGDVGRRIACAGEDGRRGVGEERERRGRGEGEEQRQETQRTDRP